MVGCPLLLLGCEGVETACIFCLGRATNQSWLPDGPFFPASTHLEHLQMDHIIMTDDVVSDMADTPSCICVAVVQILRMKAGCLALRRRDTVLRRRCEAMR